MSIVRHFQRSVKVLASMQNYFYTLKESAISWFGVNLNNGAAGSVLLASKESRSRKSVGMKWNRTVIWMTVCVIATLGSATAQDRANTMMREGRLARNKGDIEALRQLIRSARDEKPDSFQKYLSIALLQECLVEAAHDHQNDKVVKQAAQEGAADAEKAAKLDDKSSEAHRLAGELLGESIPHVFAGGMRFGARAGEEIERAVKLDAQNPNAYVARGKAYFFKPKAFGGDKEKAVEAWTSAIAIAADSDSAVTAHVWLARAYQATGKHESAVKEIDEASRMNPDRLFVKVVRAELDSK